MPARTPDYTPVLVETLLDQIIAILQRDFLTNLQAVNPGAGYTGGINAYHTAEEEIYVNPPEALIEPIESPVAADEQQSLSMAHIFTVSVFVTGGSTEELAQKSRDYARALVWTLGRRQDYSDYSQPLPLTRRDGSVGVTAGMQSGQVKAVVLRHIGWALKGSMNAQMARLPMVEIAIQTEEL